MRFPLRLMNDALALQIEALLFALGEPLARRDLTAMLRADLSDIEPAIAELRDRTGHGIVLVDDGVHVELRAAPEAADLIERIRREEYARDIGRAGQEALAAILYRGPLSRAQIDFIRGVNSSQTLRTLAMRGLVRKLPNPRDERSFLYEATTELLAQLGVTDKTALPSYEEVRAKLEALERAQRAHEPVPESVREAVADADVGATIGDES